jgi:hypothetical protein
MRVQNPHAHCSETGRVGEKAPRVVHASRSRIASIPKFNNLQLAQKLRSLG